MTTTTVRCTPSVVFGAVLALAACGGGPAYPAPAEPEAAVRGFLEAVKANSLPAMGELWGTSSGPAVSFMDRREMEQRLTIMQSYLRHERYEIVVGNAIGTASERVIQVRLFNGSCEPVVPFTVVRYRSGWLVGQVDLESVGNPQRRC